jgi:hypothetical protein
LSIKRGGFVVLLLPARQIAELRQPPAVFGALPPGKSQGNAGICPILDRHWVIR